MYQFIPVKNGSDITPYQDSDLVQGFDYELLKLHRPDEHWLVVTHDGEVHGHYSVWWDEVPEYNNESLGVIGHYAIDNADAAKHLLQHALERLKQQACTLAVGPMDGNTWHTYRFVIESADVPPFFLEPTNPAEWPQHWLANGFTPLAHFSSALNNDLSRRDPRMQRARQRLEKNGLHIRTLDLDRFEEELRLIYDLSVQTFTKNFLYTPITEKEFLAQYLKVKPYVQAELVLIAEIGQKPVGYLFALPDLLEQQRDKVKQTIIIKTVAVLAERSSAGLGSLLVDEAQALAHASGYSRAIHALMHDSNKSKNISNHYAGTIRRYALFAKPLTG